MTRRQRFFKSLAACEVLPWPDCRRPSNTITHPTPSEAVKQGLDLSSVRSILANSTNSFHLAFCLLRGFRSFFQALYNGLEDGRRISPRLKGQWQVGWEMKRPDRSGEVLTRLGRPGEPLGPLFQDPII